MQLIYSPWRIYMWSTPNAQKLNYLCEGDGGDTEMVCHSLLQLEHRKSKRVPERQFCFINYPKAFDCVDHNKLWKTVQDRGIPDNLTCLLRNLYAGQEATVRTGHGAIDCFQIGKGVCQGCIMLPWLYNFYVEYLMWNAGLDETQAGIKIPGKISTTSDKQMIPPLWQKVKRN